MKQIFQIWEPREFIAFYKNAQVMHLESQHPLEKMPTAVILLAGCGRRLLPLTESIPKCLLKVQGRTILSRMLEQLADAGLTDVALVIGHEAAKVQEEVARDSWGLSVTFIEVANYADCNNLVSLYEARELFDRELLLLEGDLLFESRLLRRMLAAPGNCLAVSPCRSWHTGTVVRCQDGQVAEMHLNPDLTAWCRPDTSKTVNAYRLTKNFLEEHLGPRLEAKVSQGERQAYYEAAISELLTEGQFRAIEVGDLRWCEVDDHKDLEIAQQLFAPPEERYRSAQSLHGGYWRQLIVDHSYLYNCHFPPEELFTEFHRDLRSLVANYPVGQQELARLASHSTQLPPAWIAVANGASELIRILGQLFGEWTLPVPSFNEFETAIPEECLQRYQLKAPNFDVDVEELAAQAHTKWVIVVSPNNPTSRVVPKADLRALAKMLEKQGQSLLVDESFIEFSDQESLVDVLEAHPNLVLLKSLSKVFGIAGLRLGYLLSSNEELISKVRRLLPIWNINGIGEAFLRVLPGLAKSFEVSCSLVKEDRDLLYRELGKIPGIEALAPQANFVFCRTERSASELARALFESENILIKDCSNKTMADADHYLRIASRTSAENLQLVTALGRVLGDHKTLALGLTPL